MMVAQRRIHLHLDILSIAQVAHGAEDAEDYGEEEHGDSYHTGKFVLDNT